MDHTKSCAKELRDKAGEMVAFDPLADLMKEAADTIERIQSERTFWHEKWRRDWQALNEARAEVARLQKEVADLKEENRQRKDIGYQRDAALAEVERLNRKIGQLLAENFVAAAGAK